MPFHLSKPITYLITSGTTTSATKDFSAILDLISAAVTAGITFVQLREKNLNARDLSELTCRAVEITRSSNTRLMVNDRADVAMAAGADGVHLTTRSLRPNVIREVFGSELLIGVSTHSLAEVRLARDEGADFAVLGPVFETISKAVYGPPLGLSKLAEAVEDLRPFPIIGLGGVTVDNAADCIAAGAAGIAGISLFEDPKRVGELMERVLKA